MRIIVGVTGATGVEMSYELLLALRRAGCEVHLIVSRSAQMTWDRVAAKPEDASWPSALRSRSGKIRRV